MDDPAFCYASKCSTPGCGLVARYKIAAAWTSGTIRELKNYGLACDRHRDDLLGRARLHREGLSMAIGEAVGPVEFYLLESGGRDGDRPCLVDEARR